MRKICGIVVLVFATVLVVRGWQYISPIRHVYLVLIGTISPSRGNPGVVAGEVLIYLTITIVATVCLRFGYRLIDHAKGRP